MAFEDPHRVMYPNSVSSKRNERPSPATRCHRCLQAVVESTSALPLGSRALLGLLAFVYLCENLSYMPHHALCPHETWKQQDGFTLIAHSFDHSSISHLLSVITLGCFILSFLEKQLGTTGLFGLVAAFSFVVPVLYTFLGVTGVSLLFPEDNKESQSEKLPCICGFSSVLFSLLVVVCEIIHVQVKPIARICSYQVAVPVRLLTWIALLASYFILPSFTLYSSVCAIVTGYLYCSGMFLWVTPRQSTIQSAEQFAKSIPIFSHCIISELFVPCPLDDVTSKFIPDPLHIRSIPVLEAIKSLVSISGPQDIDVANEKMYSLGNTKMAFGVLFVLIDTFLIILPREWTIETDPSFGRLPRFTSLGALMSGPLTMVISGVASFYASRSPGLRRTFIVLVVDCISLTCFSATCLTTLLDITNVDTLFSTVFAFSLCRAIPNISSASPVVDCQHVLSNKSNPINLLLLTTLTGVVLVILSLRLDFFHRRAVLHFHSIAAAGWKMDEVVVNSVRKDSGDKLIHRLFAWH